MDKYPRKIEEYIKNINSIYPTIKFTYESSNKELTFLDITVYKGERFERDNILDIKTHIKQTNKQLYVHSDSYHLTTTKKAIMKGETKRYLRTNSNPSNFNKMKLELIRKLKKRGYKTNEIVQEINDVHFSKPPQTLRRKTKTTQRKLIFSTQFCDITQKIKNIIYKHWKPILKDPTLREIFPDKPVISLKTAPNLRKKLVRAKLKPTDKQTDEHTSSNTETTLTNTLTNLSISTTHNSESSSTNLTTTTLDTIYPYNLFKSSQQNYRNPIKRCQLNCTLCKHIPTKTFVISSSIKTRHAIDLPDKDKFYNCSSKNVVYLITCNTTNCKTQYVGYTQRACKQRLIEHLTDEKSPVYKHIDENNHDRKTITMHILTQAPTTEPNKEQWLKQQDHWICKLGTLSKTSHKGLNKTIFDSTIRSTT